MANGIHTLNDFKERAQAGFDNNADSMAKFGKTDTTQLKAYLLETNLRDVSEFLCPCGRWVSLGSPGWYRNESTPNPTESSTFFLNWNDNRVIRLYSIADASHSDDLIDTWITNTKGLDYCWLTRNLLMHWSDKPGWEERGLGLRFNDGLTPETERGNFSLKAWHGAYGYIEGLDAILKKAKEDFAISSIRWQERTDEGVSISAEWYSNGKITFNRADDVDEVLAIVTDMALRYENGLVEASKKRESSMAAFEIGFGRQIDLDRFADSVSKGTTAMRLWLVETSSEVDFKRFKGVDLHTWDRVFLDIGPNFAFLTVPGKGCINAAPRLATLQGEDNAGRTTLLFDGAEVFG